LPLRHFRSCLCALPGHPEPRRGSWSGRARRGRLTSSRIAESPALTNEGLDMAENGRPDIRLNAAEQDAFLRETRKGAFATIDKEGFPHVVAMNYYVKDGAFLMTSYGKAQK